MLISFLYYSHLLQSERFLSEWPEFWFYDGGFAQILYAFVMVAIMILWRPNDQSRLYAYFDQISSEPNDNVQEFGLEMTGM